MNTSRNRFVKLSIPAMAVLIVASCNNATDTAQPSRPETQTTRQSPSNQGNSTQLLAAAESFEALTEQASTASSHDLEKLVRDAKNAATAITPALPAPVSAEIASLMDAVENAHSRGDKIGIALSSIEIYRLLVSEVPEGMPIPVNVSLLDYAGFRYQADLNETPPRWRDMALAIEYATMRWSELRPMVNDAALASRFEQALTDMGRFIDSEDANLARSAVIAELDLVDELERHFSSQ